MTFLRTASTRRLLAILACMAALVGGGGAAAIALSGSSGPVPPQKPLAEAIHGAITAPEAQGITARVRFTNHLIDTSGLEGVHPLLSGADGRLWLSPDRGFRLELQSENGDAQVVANRRGFWVYDGTDNTVYRGNFRGHRHHKRHRHRHRTPSVERIQRGLDRAERHKLDVSGPKPVNIADEPGYEIRVEPGEPGGLLGGVEFAWDVAHGLPLRVGVYARGNDDPVLELVATEIGYGPVARSNFVLDPPADAEVVNVAPGRERGGRGHRGHRGRHGKGGGRTGFPVSAPQELAGLERTELRRRHGKAFITYGEGPGAILVVQKRAKRDGGDHPSPADKLELPSVSINGSTGKVLETPLGSVVHFERDGVSYTVLGSVRAEVAKAAARGL